MCFVESCAGRVLFVESQRERLHLAMLVLYLITHTARAVMMQPTICERERRLARAGGAQTRERLRWGPVAVVAPDPRDPR